MENETPLLRLRQHKDIISTINKRYGKAIREINRDHKEMLDNIERYEIILSPAHYLEAIRLRDILRVNDLTHKIIESMVGSMFKTHLRAFNIHRRYKRVVEMREVYCFIAYLHFDIKSQWLADRFKIQRQVIHHYCTTVIGKYEIYKDYRDSIHELITPEDVAAMIVMFNRKKRVYGKRKKSPEGQVQEVH